MKTYTVELRNHIKHLWMYGLIVVCWPAIVYFLMIYKKGYFQLDIALFVGGITLFVYSIPVVALHFIHYVNSRNNRFEYDPAAGQMVYQNKESKIDFGIKDIEKITVFKSWPLAEKRTLIFAWDTYNYAVIDLKDGRVLKISSLLVYELDRVVEFDNTEIKKTFYAWMSPAGASLPA